MLERLQTWRRRALDKQEGKIGYIIAWALGVPIPVLLLVYLIRGCS